MIMISTIAHDINKTISAKTGEGKVAIARFHRVMDNGTYYELYLYEKFVGLVFVPNWDGNSIVYIENRENASKVDTFFLRRGIYTKEGFLSTELKANKAEMVSFIKNAMMAY